MSPHRPPRRIPSCILFPNGLISPRRFLTASRLSCRSFAGGGFPGGGFPSGGFTSGGFTGGGFTGGRFTGGSFPGGRFPGGSFTGGGFTSGSFTGGGFTGGGFTGGGFTSGGFTGGGFAGGGFLSSRLLSDCLLTSRGLLHGVLTYSFLPGRFQFFCSLARCLLMGKLLAFDLCLSCLLTGNRLLRSVLTFSLLTGRLLSCCKQPLGFQARRLGSRRGLLPGLRRLILRRRLGDRRLHWLIDALLGRHAGISGFRCYAFRCDGFRSPFACPLGVGRRWLGGRLRYDELWRFGLLQSDYGRDRLRWAWGLCARLCGSGSWLCLWFCLWC